MDLEEKTNAARLLDAAGSEYIGHSYETGRALSAKEIADFLGIPDERVFKTLVTSSPAKKYYVFLVPAGRELDLKKAAKSVNEKSVAMIRQDMLLPLTGYVHGGCSPVGMKKRFRTVIDESADSFDKIVFSAGKIGMQFEMSLSELGKAIPFSLADISKE